MTETTYPDRKLRVSDSGLRQRDMRQMRRDGQQRTRWERPRIRRPTGRPSRIPIAAGWPTRIEPMAAAALELMRESGQFHEFREEDEPSIPD